MSTIVEKIEMAEEINETELSDDEILSNHVYHFNREIMEITF